MLLAYYEIAGAAWRSTECIINPLIAERFRVQQTVACCWVAYLLTCWCAATSVGVRRMVLLYNDETFFFVIVSVDVAG